MPGPQPCHCIPFIFLHRREEMCIRDRDESKLGFGKKFSDHMFLMDYTAGEGWHDARIVPYGPWYSPSGTYGR